MKLKKLAFILPIPLLIALLGDFCQKQTKGFRLQNVFSSSPLESNPLATSEQDLLLLQDVLKQPFYFLKKGQQCFVFLSKDEKYVLKLLRWEKLEPPFWTNWITTKRGKELIQERIKKKAFDFSSYKIAYTKLKEETGLLFLQLESNPQLNIPLQIYDNIGIRHIIQTSELAFILQKKVDNFAPYLTQKISEGKSLDLHPFFSELAHLLQNRFTSNISDSDISLEYNMGILEGKPVLFDIGNLNELKKTIPQKEFLQKETELIFSTLENRAPEIAFFLQKEIERISEQDRENKSQSPSSSSPPQ